jgi:hypothetical protein
MQGPRGRRGAAQLRIGLQWLAAWLLSQASGAAGEVLLYRNSGWQITDWKYHVGTTAPSAGPEAWCRAGFDDSGWPVAKGPFGHGIPARFGKDLREMRHVTSTLYLRTHFFVPDVTRLDHLLLDVNYSGGFVVWINGVRVASANPPPVLSHTATATAARATTPAGYESVPLRDPASFLHNGENIIAVQALAGDVADETFYIDVGLVNTRSLAHNKPAFASSVGSGRNRNRQFFQPFNAVDGTQVSFAWTDEGDPQWFYVDLTRSERIDKARYYWWGDRQPIDFRVQVSDDAATWTDVHVQTGAPKAVKTEIMFPVVAARYVRLYVERNQASRSGLSLALCEIFGPDTAFEPPELTSLALGRVATASSENRPCSFCSPPGMAVNGHVLSWWHSAPADPQWLSVDLGGLHTINRVRLFAEANNKAFSIQTSQDGRMWHEIATTRSETIIREGEIKRIVDLRFSKKVVARHVRFYGTERHDPAHGYALNQILVFHDKIGGSNAVEVDSSRETRMAR